MPLRGCIDTEQHRAYRLLQGQWQDNAGRGRPFGLAPGIETVDQYHRIVQTLEKHRFTNGRFNVVDAMRAAIVCVGRWRKRDMQQGTLTISGEGSGKHGPTRSVASLQNKQRSALTGLGLAQIPQRHERPVVGAMGFGRSFHADRRCQVSPRFMCVAEKGRGQWSHPDTNGRGRARGELSSNRRTPACTSGAATAVASLRSDACCSSCASN